MRNARLVGPGPDGTSLILTDDDGEELVLAADDRLRAALRAPGPRPPALETPMDTSLSPRDIQARIRAGESLADVSAVAGLEHDRVERFAAPVLAERDNIALMALACPVRRRGETAGHRLLRATVADRLLKRGVDVDTIDWDAYRLEDGRWAVTAAYRLGAEDQRASFAFDLRGRYTIASDDPARWLIGEEPAGSAGPGRGPRESSNEPTVDLSDELALVRVVQEPAPEVPATPEPTPDLPPVRSLRAVPAAESGDVAELPRDTDAAQEPAADEPEHVDQPEPAPEVAEGSELTALYAMLGPDGYSEDSPRVYAGLSDASAVPETAGGGWEPAIVVNYPVEPSLAEEAELAPAEHPDRSQVPMDDKSSVELSTPVDDGPPPADQLPGTDEPAPPYARTDAADRADEAGELTDAEEFQLEEAPAPEPAKRKRASVPSWDEIMFGGPKPPS